MPGPSGRPFLQADSEICLKTHKDIFIRSSFFLYDSDELLLLIRCNNWFPLAAVQHLPVPFKKG